MNEKEVLKELIKSIELKIGVFEERLIDVKKELNYYNDFTCEELNDYEFKRYSELRSDLCRYDFILEHLRVLKNIYSKNLFLNDISKLVNL